MVNKNSIKLFGDDKIRAIWDDEQEKWYFSVVDVVAVLTNSKDFQTARKYWNHYCPRKSVNICLNTL